jgi:hypothetical protein
MTRFKSARHAQRFLASHNQMDTSEIPELRLGWGDGRGLERRNRDGEARRAGLGVAVAAFRSGFRITRAQLACRASSSASCCRPCWRA